MLSDHNCRIFDINRFDYLNHDSDEILTLELEKAKADIALMATRGFHNFFCPIRHNQDISVSYTKANIKRLETFARKFSPRGFGKITITPVPKIYLSPEAPYIKNLSSLTIKKSNYIYVELPLDFNPDHVPSTLNKLLFTCRLIPIFTEFQLYAMLYDPDEIRKMLRIKGAAFQFNVKTAHDPKNIRLIKRILNEGNTVLLGTNCNHDSLNINEISQGIDRFKREITEKTYREIIINAKKFLN